MTLNKKLLILIFALTASCSFAQTKQMPNSISNQNFPPPGNIKLLPGYIHTPGRGIDSVIGRISKENGIEIRYDNGPMSGKPALGALKNGENFLWVKEQEIDGQKFVFAYRKDNIIYANVNYLDNFIAVIKTNEDLADFLLMITTCNRKDPPKNSKMPN